MTIEAPALAAPRVTRRYDRRFYTGMAIACAIVVFVGFSPTFYLRPRFVPTSLPPYLLVHGFVFTTWIAFFIAQATLVAVRRTDIHRKLGWIGAGLAALMVVVGTTAGILSGQRDVALGQAYDQAVGREHAALTFLAVPLFSMVVFAALVAAAVSLRRQTETHKRLMLLATISLLDAAIARWPGAPPLTGVYVLQDLFIVAAIGYDLISKRRVSAVYLWGGLLIVTEQWLRGVVGQTEAWHTFARALLG